MSGPSLNPFLLQDHQTTKEWTCSECKQSFLRSKLLETHAITTDHRAYRCTKEKTCGQTFTLRSACSRHERSHSAQKAHACSRCMKSFHRKDNCHDHERTCGRNAQRVRTTLESPPTSSTAFNAMNEPAPRSDGLRLASWRESAHHAVDDIYMVEEGPPEQSDFISSVASDFSLWWRGGIAAAASANVSAASTGVASVISIAPFLSLGGQLLESISSAVRDRTKSKSQEERPDFREDKA